MNTLTLNSIFDLFIKIVDLGIVWALMYYVLKVVRNNSRTMQIFKGILLIFVLYLVTSRLGLTTVSTIFQMFWSWGFLAIIIIFQPELRGLLEKIGKSSVFSSVNILTGNEKAQLVDQLVSAARSLSNTKTGALITLEQGQSLTDYIKTGTAMNSVVSAELLTALFVTTTPLHDGAVILKGDRIACASAYFPPTQIELPPRYGARHRAAIGISEITDSVTIVVSEETGTISIAQEGKLTVMSADELRDFLMHLLAQNETEVSRAVKGNSGRHFHFAFGQGKLERVDHHQEETTDQKDEPAAEDSPKTTKKSKPRRIRRLPWKHEDKPNETDQTVSYADKKREEAQSKVADTPADSTADTPADIEVEGDDRESSLADMLAMLDDEAKKGSDKDDE